MNPRRAPLPLLTSLVLLAACGSNPPSRPAPESASTHSPSPGAPQDYSATIAYLKTLIAQELKTTKAQGLSIALVEDQRILWSQGFGYASREKNLPATPETVYRIGSITKLFTATALLELRAQGKVDLDNPS